jgi:hypothetical protein
MVASVALVVYKHAKSVEHFNKLPLQLEGSIIEKRIRPPVYEDERGL